MNNQRPRYQIYIGYGDDGQVRYYFENTDPDFIGERKPGLSYGRCMLYKGRNFVYKLKAHDAIEYCIALNAEDAAKEKPTNLKPEPDQSKDTPKSAEPQNNILPLRTGGSGCGWFPFLFR